MCHFPDLFHVFLSWMQTSHADLNWAVRVLHTMHSSFTHLPGNNRASPPADLGSVCSCVDAGATFSVFVYSDSSRSGPIWSFSLCHVFGSPLTYTCNRSTLYLSEASCWEWVGPDSYLILSCIISDEAVLVNWNKIQWSQRRWSRPLKIQTLSSHSGKHVWF